MSEALHIAAHEAPGRRLRVVTAGSLFDGHDAAINIVRRVLQAQGAEVVHLGHDRSVAEIATAAVQEDADAVAISSYQGGHLEFFTYLVEQLRERGAGHVRVYGGGGGTITDDEARELEARGVARIFGSEAGRKLGLEGMIRTIVEDCAVDARPPLGTAVEELAAGRPGAIGRIITWLEEHGSEPEALAVRERLGAMRGTAPAPVVGFTGTGGAGKSSVVDELLRRFRHEFPECSIALLLVDPTRRRSGGALLGDRIRMNAIHGDNVFVHSLATRQANRALSGAIVDAVRVVQAASFDLIWIETAGIGQSDSEVVDRVDHSLYVMTPEYGAPSQLEKIDMLDLADIVVLNKADRRGADDALRDVRKQWRRNRGASALPDEETPVFATTASRWDDPGTDRLYVALRERLMGVGDALAEAPAASAQGLVPGERSRYLAEIAETVRDWHASTRELAQRAADIEGLRRAMQALGGDESALAALRARHEALMAELDPELREALTAWPERAAAYADDAQSYRVRDRDIQVENHSETLAGTRLAKVAVPRREAWGELTHYLREENLPGHFPFTAGVFPFRREEEDPARMFAGEGTPERTNRRFQLIGRGQPAARLSTAFDSVTLYGRDPGERLDIWGKVGNSGVSVCTVDDAKKLYSGFDLCDPTTSVSMTINGPAPTVLAFFLNAAIDQQIERHLKETGGLEAVRAQHLGPGAPRYAGPLPEGHDGFGLGLLGIPGAAVVDPEIYGRIRADVLRKVRGTVQADILKEDQAQNTCIFSTEFSLRVMGDIQEWFIANDVRNFYSVSISGYHIAEAGANPITQLAFTLANAFTYVEYYRARGMDVDAFAPNFSFFFSNGLDAEYAVIGRVARRIWALAMREVYAASERSQKLKYHVQTSGRSLHAQEMAFNDIRTTLQALTAIEDACNSLHTNAYDEAVTTPTEESVRRALAIQLIIQREFGLTQSQNSLQGSYAIERLTDQVEAAVLREFERLSERGGVLGAMETHYQRGKIQDESLHFESLKHSGELPVVGVNTFENPQTPSDTTTERELIRSSDAEKTQQVENLTAFHARHAAAAPAALRRLQDEARRGGNVFSELMETVKVASLGQISDALFDVGGRYRRSM
ncbi:MAG: cobalamin-dependent protein [Deltaproteobacteria bacterium]|nr:cobalamin-dependent protein [Deltaproteobacteria bacterium]